MALDPQVQAVLELVAKAGRPAYHTLSPKDARQLFLETRPASTPTPPEIGSVKNVVAETPPERSRCGSTGRPVSPRRRCRVRLLPRGGWVIGDLDPQTAVLQLRAASGAA